jgi:hypothetical protein
MTPTSDTPTASCRVPAGWRSRRPAALVLILATLALAATVLAHPPHAPPLYDGVGFPDEPYRWVVPPQGEQRTRLAATEAFMRIPVTGGANVESQARSDEKGPQILLTALAGAFAVPPGASSIMMRAVPRAVPDVQPDDGHVVSNLYVITAEAEGRPVALTRDYSLALNLRAVRSTAQAVVVCRWTGTAWQQLATARIGVDIYAAWLDTIGPVALVQLDPGVTPQPAPLGPSSTVRNAGPGVDALWLAFGVVVLLIAGSLLVLRGASRRRT